MTRKTVVLVCMVDSIHVARWIAQFDPKEVKFIIFPSGPNRRVHPNIVEMIKRGKQFDNQMTLVPFGGKLSLPLWALDRLFGDRIRGLLLRRVLKKIQPDFVHALEFQHAGYVTIRALEDKSIKTPFIATNYGSDIYWFQRFTGHSKKIRALLSRADFYSAECERDVLLARDFGYVGTVLPVVPNAGGLNKAWLDRPRLQASQRDVIVIKAYESWAGQAQFIRQAISLIPQELKGFSLVLYSGNIRTLIWSVQMRMLYGLDVAVHLKNKLDHEELLDIFSKSKLYIALSKTDGLSTSMLEAMCMGAFPLQSGTACIEHIITNNRNGVVLDTTDPANLAAEILSALSDEVRLNRAMEENRMICATRFSQDKASVLARSFY